MPRQRTVRITSAAELVKRVTFGESDLVVTLFTERAGTVPAMARAARASRRRFAGLEPMHRLEVDVDIVPGRELGTLVESRLVRPRLTLTSSLACLEAAGTALRWIAEVAPAHVPEPLLWQETEALLDALDAPLAVEPSALVAGFGLRLLGAAGWALELDQCVRCGRSCPPASAGRIDVELGGLVCRTCGAAPVLVTARQRRALGAAMRGDTGALAARADAELTTALVVAAIGAHGRGPR